MDNSGGIIEAQQLEGIFSSVYKDWSSLKHEPKFLKERIIPYFFGSYIKDPGKFFGRIMEQRQILDYLHQASQNNYWHVAVIGDYRIGKSSLLRVLDYKIADETNSFSVFLDLSTIRQENFFQTIISKISDIVFSRTDDHLIIKKFKKAIDTRRYQEFRSLDIEADIFGVFKLKADPKQGKHWNIFEKALSALIKRLRKKEDCSSIVVIIDEVSSISTWEGYSEILKQWRGMAQRLEGYNFLIGSAYPLYQLTKDEWSPFYNIFATIRLKNMAPNESRDLIIEPAQTVGINFSEKAIRLIQSLTSNNPYYIQVLCTSICERMLKMRQTGIVTEDLVEDCLSNSIEVLNENFVSLWENSTPFQQKILLECARTHGENYKFDQKALSPNEFYQFMLLMDRSIIHNKEDGVRILGLFASWINRYYEIFHND